MSKTDDKKAPETPAPEAAKPLTEAAKPSGEIELPPRFVEAVQRTVDRALSERERFDPGERTAHALQISALLELHRWAVHTNTSHDRYLRAATLLGDELASSIERAFEG